MKRITKILALVLALCLSFSMFSCDKERETDDEDEKKEVRYTITEDEWEEFCNCSNYTVKVEAFDKGYITVQRNVDGLYCDCDIIFSFKDSTAGSGNGDATVPAEAMAKAARGGTLITGSADSASETEPVITEESFVEDSGENPFNNSGVYSGVGDVDSIISGGVISGGITDLMNQKITSYYKDAAGNEYKTVRYMYQATLSMGTCHKEYEGKRYVPKSVQDMDGNDALKWIEQGSALVQGKLVVNFNDLTFDSKEKAYVYEEKNDSYAYKSYYYFENGTIVKELSFTDAVHSDEPELFDVSTLTPQSNYESDEYTASVKTYSNVGKTVIEKHTFSPSDIITFEREERN